MVGAVKVKRRRKASVKRRAKRRSYVPVPGDLTEQQIEARFRAAKAQFRRLS